MIRHFNVDDYVYLGILYGLRIVWGKQKWEEYYSLLKEKTNIDQRIVTVLGELLFGSETRKNEIAKSVSVINSYICGGKEEPNLQSKYTVTSRVFGDQKVVDFDMLKKPIINELCSLGEDKDHINRLLFILEEYGNYVYERNNETIQDKVSIYSYIKSIATILAAYYEFFIDTGIEIAEDVNCLAIVNIDIDGHKEFYYAEDEVFQREKILNRWFYYELLRETAVNEFIDKVGIYPFCKIYAGGKHSYIIVPNTNRVKQIINIFARDAKEWFLNNYGIELFLSINIVETCMKDLIGDHKKRQAIFSRLSEYNANQTRNRYKESDIEVLMSKVQNGNHTIVRYPNVSCDEDKYYLVSKKEGKLGGVPFFNNKVLSVIDSIDNVTINEGDYLFCNYDKGLLRDKNGRIVTSLRRLWIYKQSVSESIDNEKMAAVLRLDLDNSRKMLFGAEDDSVVKILSFSNALSLFMRGSISLLLKEVERRKWHVYMLYLGADDLSFAGDEEDIYKFAILLKKMYSRYLGKKTGITVSICSCNYYSILKYVAEEVDLLMWKGKKGEKDSVVLSGRNEKYSWKRFFGDFEI